MAIAALAVSPLLIFEVTTEPSGLRIEVSDEKDVDEVIAALRKVNGKLVSVQPVRQSLEDLFV